MSWFDNHPRGLAPTRNKNEGNQPLAVIAAVVAEVSGVQPVVQTNVAAAGVAVRGQMSVIETATDYFCTLTTYCTLLYTTASTFTTFDTDLPIFDTKFSPVSSINTTCAGVNNLSGCAGVIVRLFNTGKLRVSTTSPAGTASLLYYSFTCSWKTPK